MWKTWSSDSYVEKVPRESHRGGRPRTEGDLVALIGTPSGGRVSHQGDSEHLERLPRITGEILGYNLDGKLALIRYSKNDRGFDNYISLPFTKGVTERVTGRTLLILGSNAHHIEAMQGQFQGVLWSKEEEEEVKKYGNTLRWINIGDTRNGFLGLDYNPGAPKEAGVARNIEDIVFLSKTLMDFGYEPEKRLFLLKPPYIVESDKGKELRRQGYHCLRDYSKR
jgi:hypothetical protein